MADSKDIKDVGYYEKGDGSEGKYDVTEVESRVGGYDYHNDPAADPETGEIKEEETQRALKPR